MGHLVFVWGENGSLRAFVMDELFQNIIPGATAALGEVPVGLELHNGSLHRWAIKKTTEMNLVANNGRPGYVFDLHG